MQFFKKILCPTDFSQPSYEAVKVASELALQFSAALSLVHVLPSIPIAPIPTPPIQTPTPLSGFNIPLYQKELETSAEQSLRQVVQQRIAKELKASVIVAVGEAALEIVRIATEEKVDLIVIATHGRTGWQHVVFGSVAEKVIRLAPCPVLTIRIPNELMQV